MRVSRPVFRAIRPAFHDSPEFGATSRRFPAFSISLRMVVTTAWQAPALAASKAKGMWMGRIPPLGYKPQGRTLVVVEEHARGESILAGRIVDAAGEPLIASHARKDERRYRYYVSKALHHEGRGAVKDAMRIPAAEIEQVVAQECANLLQDPLHLVERAGLSSQPTEFEGLLEWSKALAKDLAEGRHALLASIIHKVRVEAAGIRIELLVAYLAKAVGLTPSDASPSLIEQNCVVRLTRTGRALRLVDDKGAATTEDGVDLTLVSDVAPLPRRSCRGSTRR